MQCLNHSQYITEQRLCAARLMGLLRPGWDRGEDKGQGGGVRRPDGAEEREGEGGEGGG